MGGQLAGQPLGGLILNAEIQEGTSVHTEEALRGLPRCSVPSAWMPPAASAMPMGRPNP
ncbi:MAG: hypothetical protein ACKOPT_08590 [Cyanobium sp.]